MNTCRSCHAKIVWAVTPGGKRMPVDAAPVDDGNVLLDRRQDPPLATVIGGGPQLWDEPGERHTSHFATCPDSDAHRRPR